MRPGHCWFKQRSLFALLATWAVLALPGCGGCGGSDLTGGGDPLDGDSLRLTTEAIAGLQPLLENTSLALPDSLQPLAAKFKAAYEKEDRNRKAKAGYAIAEAARLASLGVSGLPPETGRVQPLPYPAKTLKKHLLALNLGWIDGKVWRGTAEDGAPFRSMTVIPLLETTYSGVTGQALTDLLNGVKTGLTNLDAFLETQGEVVTDADPLVFSINSAERKFGAVELKELRACIKSVLAELNLTLAYNFTGATGLEEYLFQFMKFDPTRDGGVRASAAQYLPAEPYATLPAGGQAMLAMFGSLTAASADTVTSALALQEARTDQAGWISRPPIELSSSYSALTAEADLLKMVVTGPVRLVVDPQVEGGRYEGTLNVPAFLNGGAPTDLRSIYPRVFREEVNWGGSDFGGLLSPEAVSRFWEDVPYTRRDAIRYGINVFMDCVGRGWDEVLMNIQWAITPI